MSRAAVAAKQQAARRLAAELARLDAWRAALERDAAVDAVLAACELCGLEQAATGPHGRPCLLCGSDVARYVEALPGHYTGARTATGGRSGRRPASGWTGRAATRASAT